MASAQTDLAQAEPIPGNLPVWGVLAKINLRGCHPGALRNEHAVRDFFQELVPALGMKAYGDLQLHWFGEGDLYGITAVQLIYTSHIAWHADEKHRRCFLHVFTCGHVTPAVAARIAERYFGGVASVTVSEEA